MVGEPHLWAEPQTDDGGVRWATVTEQLASRATPPSVDELPNTRLVPAQTDITHSDRQTRERWAATITTGRPVVPAQTRPEPGQCGTDRDPNLQFTQTVPDELVHLIMTTPPVGGLPNA